ncbi:MAG: TonB-dependent receptor [Bacteroidia bacterium]
MKNFARTFLFVILFLSFSFFSVGQERFTISGYVKDAKNGEAIIGANVYLKGTSIGASTNVYGFYSLSLPAGNDSVTISYIGYTVQTKVIELNKNTTLNAELEEESTNLNEVVISSEKEDVNVKSMEMSVTKLDIKQIQKIPALLGEVDVIRSIQLLPGVTTVGEGASGFNVRGGNIDQNLVLLDEAPVYNSSHLFGFFSVFNPDAVKDVKLIKAGIPAQYGGRLSSILDIRMKEGNNKQLQLNGGIGTIFSRFSIEAPILKNKASFILAGRRSYIDVLAKPFLAKKQPDLKDAKFNFYDLTAKVNYRINDKNTIFLSGYFGRDVFGAGFKFNWGNTTSTLRWNHLFTEKLFMNATVFYSNYDYLLGFKDESNGQSFDWNSKIINYSVKPDFIYYINNKNTLRFGGQSILYDFNPATAVVTASDGGKTNISLDHKYGLESAFYLDNEQKINSRISVQYGLRYSLFDYMGKGNAFHYYDTIPNERKRLRDTVYYGKWKTIQQYGNFEPRISFKMDLTDNSSVKASYNRTAQYIHLVSNTAASTPLDVWTPSTNNVKPQLCDQFAMGYFRNFKDNMFETSVEVYYKTMQNQLDYIDNSSLFLNKYIEADLLQGKGRAYGAEFYVKKTKGKLNGWISYTLSRTERKVDGLSKGEWYLNRYDRTHNLNTVATYDLSKRWSFSANFVLYSGTPATFPTSKIEIQGYTIPYNTTEKRNNFRITPYHRLDISATYNFKKNEKRKWQSSIVMSVYNVYNRRNAFAIYFRSSKDNPVATEAVRYSVIGSFVPAVTYNFKF